METCAGLGLDQPIRRSIADDLKQREANVPPDGETTRITHITQYGNQRDETFQPNSRWKTLPLPLSSSFLPPLLPFFLSPHTRRHTQTHTPQCHRRGPPPPHKSILPSGSEEHAEIERGQANKAGWKDAENKSILVWRRRTLKGLKIAGLTKAWINKNECASGFIIYFPQEEAPLLSHTHTLRDSLVARLQHLWLPSTGLKVLFTSAACVQPPSFYPSFEI